MTEPADRLRAHLKGDLRSAMKVKDGAAVKRLRRLIAAVDNAEAVPLTETGGANETAGGGQPYRGSAYAVSVGAGPTEVPRRRLCEERLREILRQEQTACREAAQTLLSHGRGEDARALLADAEAAEPYIRLI